MACYIAKWPTILDSLFMQLDAIHWDPLMACYIAEWPTILDSLFMQLDAIHWDRSLMLQYCYR